ncbi:MAG: VCBS repeat-containing protein [Acidobacteriota bacterium]|nr:VCBS repeat-containing protein [Acidobacteriota bacterium]
MKLSKPSPKTQNLIGCGVLVLLIFVGIGGYIGWRVYSFFSEFSTRARVEIPDELSEPRVLKGAEFLSKNEIFKLNQGSYVETVKKAAAAADEKEKQRIISGYSAKKVYNFDDLKICGGEIVAAGEFGVQVLDLNGGFKRGILFEPTLTKIKMGWYQQDDYKPAADNLQIVDFDGDGKCEFFSHGTTEGVTAYGNDGNIIWKYGGEETADVFKERDIENEVYVTEAAAGDLDGDGTAEYIVGRSNDGIRAFDRNGNEKWFQPEEFPSAAMQVLDVDGDGRGELLEIGSKTKIRDGLRGNVVAEPKGGYSDMLLFTEDKNKRKALQFCDIDGNKLVCADENGTKFIESEAPLSEVKAKTPVELPKSTPIDFGNGVVAVPGEAFGRDTESVYKPKAVWVSLRKDKPKYLAVIASFIGIPRANFYIYEPNGTLVYHELLPEDAETIAAIPANQTDEIVIAGKDTIWKFTPR